MSLVLVANWTLSFSYEAEWTQAERDNNSNCSYIYVKRGVMGRWGATYHALIATAISPPVIWQTVIPVICTCRSSREGNSQAIQPLSLCSPSSCLCPWIGLRALECRKGDNGERQVQLLPQRRQLEAVLRQMVIFTIKPNLEVRVLKKPDIRYQAKYQV